MSTDTHVKTEAVDRRAAALQRASDHRWLILVFVSIAQLMVVLDATIVNIALPSAQADLGFADSNRQWIVTAYALVFGSLLLLGGRLGDAIGRKHAFLLGLAGFALASAVGGAANSFGVLVTARAFQGLFGAVLAPAALSTLVTTFRSPKDRGKAFGVFGSVAVAGGAVGLILGGVLTEYLSWRWAMYVNVLFAIVAAAGAWVYMVNERPAVRERIDITGAVLASAGLFGLVFGFSHAESAGWLEATALASWIIGAVLLAGFFVIGVPGIAMFGVSLCLTYYLQLVRGYSPVMSGLAFLPMIACVVISSNTSNIVTLPRFGPRIIITIGMTLGFLALAYLSRIDIHSSYVGGILPALLVMGFAMGMVMAPAMNTATAGVRHSDAGVAAALASTMQQVGGSIGTAVLSTVAASATTTYLADHGTVAQAAAVAATHGYVLAFAIGSALFLAGAIAAVICFPSKARIAEIRAAANGDQPASRVEGVEAEIIAVEL